MANQSINLNLIPDGIKPIAKVSQFDVGRIITFSLYENGEPYNPPAGTAVEVRGQKNDKKIFVYDESTGYVSRSGSVITLSTSQQMTAAAGEALCQFKLTHNYDVIATLNFWLDIQTDPAANGDISESEIPGIVAEATEQMHRAEAAAIEAAADALDAEAYGAGTRGSDPVGSSDPAYHNNAKWYSEDADASATSAGLSKNAAEDSAKDSEAYAIGKRNGQDVPSTDPAYQNNSKYYSDLASAWASNPPYVGANGDWYVYNPATQQFEDTGIDASITMEIRDITMLTYGSTPTVENSGTSTDAVFHLGIPRAAGIQSVTKTGSSGLVDTYRMLFQDGYHFDYQVTNGSGGGSAHIIENENGQNMPARTGLQFVGATVTDDSTNDRTVVTIQPGGTTIVQKPTVVVGTYTYNGTAQGPTITWATGMEDNCIVTNGTKTDAGTYTLTIALKNTAKMVWAGDETTADLTYEYTIDKADQTVSLSTNSVTLDADHLTASVTVTGAQGAISVTTSDNTVATASVSGSVVTISNVNQSNGSATITVSVAGTNNYNAATDSTVSVTASFSTWVDLWLTAAGLNPSSYADLDAVLADEEAIRRLFTRHASVNYLVTNKIFIGTTDLTTLLNDDYVAKWINLRDYALDTLYADSTIAGIMDTADKYFYGEWTIVDSTTTPPTWGPKGNVPVMTSNTAPYGEASASSEYSSGGAAWKVFDNDVTTSWSAYNITSNQYVRYKFTNPTMIKRVRFVPKYSSACRVKNYKIEASNDDAQWDTLYTGLVEENKSYDDSPISVDIINTNYYLYYRIFVVDSYETSNISINTIQFYGRELRVSVPTMTSNTAPYGEAFASSEYTYSSGGKAFNAFDGQDGTTVWVSTSNTNQYCGYKFPHKVSIRFLYLFPNNLACIKEYKFQGSNDGSTWIDLQSGTVPQGVKSYLNVDNNDEYMYYRIYVINTYSGNVSGLMQFYGLDYSEYDWDADNPRHYLYDHGVELETITISGTATKEPDSIRLSAASAQATHTLDTTDYDLLRGEVGSNASGTNALICGSGTASFIASNMPYNQSLDVSSINGLNATGVQQTAAGVFDAASIWLE